VFKIPESVHRPLPGRMTFSARTLAGRFGTGAGRPGRRPVPGRHAVAVGPCGLVEELFDSHASTLRFSWISRRPDPADRTW